MRCRVLKEDFTVLGHLLKKQSFLMLGKWMEVDFALVKPRSLTPISPNKTLWAQNMTAKLTFIWWESKATCWEI